METQPLPIWADNDETRALVAAVLADPPERTITRGTWIEGGGAVRFHGGVTGKLRRLYDEWFEREDDKLLAHHAATGEWDQAASNALCRVEDADQLIERLLTAEQLTETVGDPLKDLAA